MTDHTCTLRDPRKVLDWALTALSNPDAADRSVLEAVWDHALAPVGAYVDLMTPPAASLQSGGEESMDFFAAGQRATADVVRALMVMSRMFQNPTDGSPVE